MFAAAPPTFVIALICQSLWIPFRFVQLATSDEHTVHIPEINTAIAFVSFVFLLVGSWELVRRGHGRVRGAMLVTVAMTAGELVLRAYVLQAPSRHASTMFFMLGWVSPIMFNVAMIGLAVAAGRRSLGTSIVTIAATMLVFSIPPMHAWIRGMLGGLTFWLDVAATTTRSVFAIMLVAAIAKQCEAPVHDHRRAARAFALLAWLVAAHAVFAVVMVVLGDATLIVQVWMIGIEVLFLVVHAGVIARIAQTQLPRLPSFALHVAAAALLMSAFLVSQIAVWILTANIVDDWYEKGDLLQIQRWKLVPVALAAILVITSLGRYAKHAREIKRSVALGGSVLAATFGLDIVSDQRVSMWIGVAAASIALLPAFRAMATAVAGDPAQTTADVFA